MRQRTKTSARFAAILPQEPERAPALPYSRTERACAAALGAGCHAAFGVAVSAMVVGLHEGLRFGAGRLDGAAAWSANTVLALSFPLLLVALDRKRRPQPRPSRARLDRAGSAHQLAASLHLLVVFALWSPTGAALWRAEGASRVVSELAFAASWLLLAVAMRDAGLAVQTGFLGWGAVARGQRPCFPSFASSGLFRFTRQPVYVAFALTLWTAPTLTLDRLLLAGVWTLYCLGGPLLKERRILAREGDGYRRYQEVVPYWLPRLTPGSPER